MLKLLTATLAVALFSSAAYANGVDCPHPWKPKHHKPKVKPPVAVKCDCPPGEPGKQGPPGEPGKPGQVKVIHVHDKAPAATIPLGVGVFATGFANGDWAWGPALQITGKLTDNYEATLMGGLANLATKNRESGYTLRVGLQRDLGNQVALGAGLGYLNLKGSPVNGQIDGSYLTLDVGVAINGNLGPIALNLNLMPIVIGFLDDTFQGSSTQLGSSANLMAGVQW